MKRRQSFKLRGDIPLIITVFLLLVIGVLAVYSAVYHDYPDLVWPILGQQIAWIVLGWCWWVFVRRYSPRFIGCVPLPGLCRCLLIRGWVKSYYAY